MRYPLYCFLQQCKQLFFFLCVEIRHKSAVPIKEHTVGGFKSLLPALCQMQQIMTPGFFLGNKTVRYQSVYTSLAVSPVKRQILGQLRRSATRLFSDVHDKKQKPEIQLHLLQALPGKRIKAAVQHGDVIRKCFLKHGSWTFISFHIHSIIFLLDFVK